MSLYADKFKCPKGHERIVYRQWRSQGKTVATYCTVCNKSYLAFSPRPERRIDSGKAKQ